LAESCCPSGVHMPCSWLYLETRTASERFCDEPGHPYCPEHQREMDAMAQADKDWDEILATHRTVCEKLKEEQKLCVVCGRRPVHLDCPVHDDCVYCEVCCADDALNLRRPKA
jgi:hypothetical protein